MLIVFEGIDGTGKSTQVALLAEALQERGYEVVSSREPSDGPFGKKLRDSMVTGRLGPEEELALFHEDRRDHVEHVILPALEAGKVVLLDRYYFSTMAYQGARGFDPQEIRRQNEDFAPVPDAVLLLELPVEAALQRIGIRDGEGNAFEKSETLSACARIFSDLQEDWVHRFDASQSPSELHQSVLQAVLTLLPDS
ncbi:dTMP kinase [Roseibacillus ishigakijimensis]|uniref:Thymidylate kinase n=1 Tax=Roseibacillus ishigakijimensis TaxID=454146 RepID=A0A934RPP3_9BACT|nr:dTMP kinase [Roseibacillus ishigakijimensis]MBK1833291.1 dTMP kinase [Roseibacillus ishigakijimensis]